MSSRTPLFIDFDRVLFDTDPLRQALAAVLTEAGFDAEAAQISYREATVDHMYTPAKHLAAIHAHQPEVQYDEAVLLEKMYATLSNRLMPDAIPFLERLNREAYGPQLLTLGDPDFQQRKIDLTGIARYFDGIQICTVEKQEYLPDLVGEQEPFVLIDDRQDTVLAINARFPHAFTIFKDYRNEQPDYTAERSLRIISLNELAGLPLPAPFSPLVLGE